MTHNAFTKAEVSINEAADKGTEKRMICFFTFVQSVHSVTFISSRLRESGDFSIGKTILPNRDS